MTVQTDQILHRRVPVLIQPKGLDPTSECSWQEKAGRGPLEKAGPAIAASAFCHF